MSGESSSVKVETARIESSGHVEFHYLVHLSDVRFTEEYLSLNVELCPRVLFANSRVSLIHIMAPETLEYPAGAQDWATLVVEHAERFVESYPCFNPETWGEGRKSIGSWFHVVRRIEDDVRGEPIISADWDYLFVANCDNEDFQRVLQVTAVTSARYVALRTALDSTRSIMEKMTSSADLSLGEDLSTSRRALIEDRVLIDIRPSLYWGYEIRLLDQLRVAWRLDLLEEVVEESVSNTSLLLQEKQADSLRVSGVRTNRLLLFVSMLSGISALLALVEFVVSATPWKWLYLPRVIAATTVLVGVSLFLWRNWRHLASRERFSG